MTTNTARSSFAVSPTRRRPEHGTPPATASEARRGRALEAEALFEEYQVRRDPAVRDMLVDRFTPLVSYLANRFANRGEPVEDLRQIAFIGLIKAIERFDPTAGARFMTYATPTIVGEIKRHFRDKGWMLKVPRRLQETHLAINRMTEQLMRVLGRPPVPAELTEALGVPLELVLEALELGQNYHTLSLDVQTGGDDSEKSAALTDFLGEMERGFERTEAKVDITTALQSLSPQEQTVVYLSYFRDQTQVQIARRIGVSQMQVSRILHRALSALRRTLTEEEARAFSAATANREAASVSASGRASSRDAG